MSKFKFKIITPERVVYQDEVDEVTVPTKSGQITVLSGHIPLASLLQPGELVIRKGGEEVVLAVSRGFIEMSPENELIILADAAERAEEIDIAAAEEARARALEAKSKKEHLAAEDFARLQAVFDHELARLKVAQKHRSRRHQ